MQADREALEILLNECREARRRLEDAFSSEIDPINGAHRLNIDDQLERMEGMLLTLIPDAPSKKNVEPIYKILLGTKLEHHSNPLWEIFYYTEKHDQYATSYMKENGTNGLLNDGFINSFCYEDCEKMITKFDLEKMFDVVSIVIGQSDESEPFERVWKGENRVN